MNGNNIPILGIFDAQYYRGGMITLINGDCMEYMKGMKDKQFDLAIDK